MPERIATGDISTGTEEREADGALDAYLAGHRTELADGAETAIAAVERMRYALDLLRRLDPYLDGERVGDIAAYLDGTGRVLRTLAAVAERTILVARVHELEQKLAAEQRRADALVESAAVDREDLRRALRTLDAVDGVDGCTTAALAATVAVEQIRDLGQQLREVYRERAHLVAWLAAARPAVLVEHDADDTGWPILYVDLPTGQASWHISRDDLDLFAHVPRGTAVWDGHSTEEKYRRVDADTAGLAAAPNLAVDELGTEADG